MRKRVTCILLVFLVDDTLAGEMQAEEARQQAEKNLAQNAVRLSFLFIWKRG